MGILGEYMPNWLPDDPNKNAAARDGLLAFGASLMQGRGNLGSILGAGLMAGSSGYHNALDNQQRNALAAAQQRRLDLDNQETQAKLDEPAQIASIFGGSTPTTLPAASPGVGMPIATPSTAPLQGFRSPQPSWMPGAGDGAQQTPTSMAPAPLPAAPVAAPSTSVGLYQKYMDYGDRLTQAGRVGAAKPYYDMAAKLRPQIKEQKVLTTPDGKRVVANVFEDGTTQILDGFAPDKEKLVGHDGGGTYDFSDPYTGKVVSSAKKTVSPSEALNRQTQLDVQRMITARQANGGDIGVTHGVKGLSPEQNEALFGVNGAVTTGRLDPNRINSKTASLYADAFIKNPSMDMAKTSGDIALGRNAAFRQKAMVAETLPEVMQNMVDAGKKVGFSDNRTIGKMQAWAKGEFNDPDMTSYMVQRNDALMTIAGVMRGMGMTDMAHRAEEEASHATMSPAALDAWMRAQMKSLQPRLDVNRKITREGPSEAKAEVLPREKLPKLTPSASTQPYADAEKERRYQEWKRSQGK